jgi:hypothetical protein
MTPSEKIDRLYSIALEQLNYKLKEITGSCCDFHVSMVANLRYVSPH